jgi:CubicO group peptidase (beta-lactamase class C family)
MIRNLLLFLAAMLCLARPCVAAEAVPLTAEDLNPWRDGFFPNALKQADIAGAVVIVVKDGQVVAKKGYGYADVVKRIPMDPDRTIVGVGSVSKLFAWTAVMQLVEQGKLDLDADINRYLDFKIPPYQGKPITLRNLMTHSAGFAERGFKVWPEGQTPRTLGAYLKGTPVPDRIYAPGTVAAYSNYGAAAGLWNAWATVRGPAPWWSKVWSVLLALALVEIVWFSFSFHLISAGLNY